MAGFTLQGSIINVLNKRSGISSKGIPWTSQCYVMNATDGQSEFKFTFDLFGEELIALYDLREGDRIRLTVSINAKPNKDGKWYNQFNVRNIIKL